MNKQLAAESKVFSFDVFDTCVTRCCARPTDLFERLFVELLAEQRLPSYELIAAAKSLARSRVAAETTARQQSDSDDTTLNAIYRALEPSLKPYGISAANASAAEIELELATVSPILQTQLRIKQLRAEGSKVIFISDMYLPGQVVRQMLIDHGFSDGSDEVYVSADSGLSKGSGRLFPFVCNQLNITPKQLHHTGDNRYADVRAARQQGVKATYFIQGAPNRYERGFRAELVDDDWMRSHLIGLSRSIRLGHDTGDAHSSQHTTLAADVLAPLVVGYLIWVITTAKEVGIEHLYFENDGLRTIGKAICNHWPEQNDQPKVLPTCHQLTPEDKETKSACIFTLLSAIEQSQIVGDFSTPKALQMTYIEAPVKSRRRLEGTAHLYKHSPILEQLISTLSTDELSIYRATVLNYAAKFLQPPTIQESDRRCRPSERKLNQLKQYAIGNASRLILSPTRAEAQAISTLQTASANKTKPIRLWEVPNVSKSLLKEGRGYPQNTWLEGAIALSPFPIRASLLNLQQVRKALAKSD